MSQRYHLVITKSRISAENILEHPVVLAIIEYPDVIDLHTIPGEALQSTHDVWSDVKYIAMHYQADEFIRNHLSQEPEDGGPYSFTKHMVPVLPQTERFVVTPKEPESTEVPNSTADFTINLDDYPNQDSVTFKIVKTRKM